jgi:hypothetical protein
MRTDPIIEIGEGLEKEAEEHAKTEQGRTDAQLASILYALSNGETVSVEPFAGDAPETKKDVLQCQLFELAVELKTGGWRK